MEQSKQTNSRWSTAFRSQTDKIKIFCNVKKTDGQENTENAEISTPVNAPKVTSIRVETYGIDYGMPETLTPFQECYYGF